VSDRRLLREAVLGRSIPRLPGEPPLRAVAGRVLDASPHLLVLRCGDSDLRLPMSDLTSVWPRLEALRPGREVIARTAPAGFELDRVWVDIVRVTGTIVAQDRDRVRVDQGPHRPAAEVLVPPSTRGQVLVRHPRFEPGYLIDVITTRSAEGLTAVRPASAQPEHRADAPPPAPARDLPRVMRGTATWFSGPARRGAAYPAVDPEGDGGGCTDAPQGCAALPYLSVGSELVVRNECSVLTCTAPVIECGCVAARYCDRCLVCGTSPRGRVAELTALSFVELGGDLESGCFNVTLSVG
jgi:hypothetical protein